MYRLKDFKKFLCSRNDNKINFEFPWKFNDHVFFTNKKIAVKIPIDLLEEKTAILQASENQAILVETGNNTILKFQNFSRPDINDMFEIRSDDISFEVDFSDIEKTLKLKKEMETDTAAEDFISLLRAYSFPEDQISLILEAVSVSKFYNLREKKKEKRPVIIEIESFQEISKLFFEGKTVLEVDWLLFSKIKKFSGNKVKIYTSRPYRSKYDNNFPENFNRPLKIVLDNGIKFVLMPFAKM